MVATVETLPEAKLCGRPRGNLCSLSRLCGEKKWSNEFGTWNLEHIDSQEEAYSAGKRRLPPLNINGANTYQFVESNPVGNVYPWGLDSSGLLPPNFVPPPAGVPAVPTAGQAISQTIGGWLTGIGDFGRATGHLLTRAAQGA